MMSLNKMDIRSELLTVILSVTMAISISLYVFRQLQGRSSADQKNATLNSGFRVSLSVKLSNTLTVLFGFSISFELEQPAAARINSIDLRIEINFRFFGDKYISVYISRGFPTIFNIFEETQIIWSEILVKREYDVGSLCNAFLLFRLPSILESQVDEFEAEAGYRDEKLKRAKSILNITRATYCHNL